MKRFLNKHERKAQLTILGVLLLLILIVISTGNVKAQGKYEDALVFHQKLQKEYSYETWKKNQPKKKIKAIKYAVWASNENYKESKANEKLNKRIERIRQRIK